MSTLPRQARAVVIGCGIVGNTVAYHLTDQGWSDVVLLDKGPLPNPGGSTGHASNFIFPVDHSKEMTQLTLESVRQYKEMGVLHRVRRHRGRAHGGAHAGAAAPHGVGQVVGDRAGLAGHARRGEGARPVHRRDRDPRRLLHARRSASSTRCGPGRSCASAARSRAALGLREHRGARYRRRGRARSARANDRGDIETEMVVIACGVWSPMLARMAGASHPAHACRAPDDRHRPDATVRRREGRHRVPDRARHGHEHVRAPARRRARDRLVRAPLDPLRPRGPAVRRGGVALADRVPVHAGGLRPADGAGARADAGDRRRRVRRHEVRDQRDPLADARRHADPRRAARGEGPLVGRRRVDQGRAGRRASRSRSGWCTASRTSTSTPRTRRASTTTRRLARTSRRAPPRGSTRRTGSSTRSSSGRRIATFGSRRTTSARRSSARSSSRRPAGSGRSGTSRTRRCSRSTATGSGRARPSGTRAGGRRSSTPSTSRCASAPGSSTSRRSRSSTCRGPVRSTRCRRVSMRAGGRRRSDGSSTRRGSRASGGFKSDLTIMRLGDEQFRVVTGGAHGMADHKWFADRLPADGSAQLVDLTSAWTTIGLWGPRARDILASLDARRRVARGLPVRDLQDDRDRPAARRSRRASRTSATSAGSSTCRSSRERGCGTCSGRPGARTAPCPCGIGVYGTTGRLEKCYRAYGAELESEYTVVEADMAWGRRSRSRTSSARRRTLRIASEEPAAILCTLTVDDHTSSSGSRALPAGPRADPSRATARRSSTRRAAART